VINRRNFLASMGAMAGTLMCRPSASDTEAVAASLAQRRRLGPIGIQLYSVRRVLASDFDGTIAQLAQIGYKKLEFAGYYNRTPAQVRDVLQRNGLTAPSAHIDLNSLHNNLNGVLDAAQTIGHEYITAPWIDEAQRKTLDDWKRLAADFNQIGERIKARGLKFAYHNHNFEFVPVGGQIPLDVLLANTQPGLVSYELDVYWITNAGQDARAYIQRYPDRFVMLHIKDSAGPPKHDQTDVGSGTIDFASVFRADQKHAVAHVFVEHDDPPNPIEFARKSYQFLEKLEV
jgi:sugar phosphate isomerase/epimerase